MGPEIPSRGSRVRVGPLGVKGQAQLGKKMDYGGVVFLRLTHSVAILHTIWKNVLEHTDKSILLRHELFNPKNVLEDFYFKLITFEHDKECIHRLERKTLQLTMRKEGCFSESSRKQFKTVSTSSHLPREHSNRSNCGEWAWHSGTWGPTNTSEVTR